MAADGSRWLIASDCEYAHSGMPNIQELIDRSKAEGKPMSNTEAYQAWGGYAAVKECLTTLVQIGAVVFDRETHKIVEEFEVIVDPEGGPFPWCEQTSKNMHTMSNMPEGTFGPGIGLSADDALASFAGLFAKYPGAIWVVMDNDYNVMMRQDAHSVLPPPPLRLKPALQSTSARGYNSGQLHQLVEDEALKASVGFDFASSDCQHTGKFDAASMVVFLQFASPGGDGMDAFLSTLPSTPPTTQ